MKVRVHLVVETDDSNMAELFGIWAQGLTTLGEREVERCLAALGLRFIGQEHKL